MSRLDKNFEPSWVPDVVPDSLQVSEVSDERPKERAYHTATFVANPDGQKSLRDLESDFKDLTSFNSILIMSQDQFDTFNRVNQTDWTLDDPLPESKPILIHNINGGVYQFEDTVDLNTSTAPQIAIESETGNLFDPSTEIIALYSNVQVGYNEPSRNVIVRVYSEMQHDHPFDDSPSLDEDRDTCHYNQLYAHVEIYVESAEGQDLTMTDGRQYTLGFKGSFEKALVQESGLQAADDVIEKLLGDLAPQIGFLENGDPIVYCQNSESYMPTPSDILFFASGIFMPSFENPALPNPY